MVLQFQNPDQMLNFLRSGEDLYCPDTNRYVGLYSDIGDIAAWVLSDKAVSSLWEDVLFGTISFWMEELKGGAIMSDSDDYSARTYCEDHYKDKWYTTIDWNIPKILLHRAA